MCSSAPDTTAQNAIAAAQVKMSQEQLDWAKQIYGETAPDRKAATARANMVSDAQLGQMKEQSALTSDYAKYNRETFRPLEQGIVDGANSYDSEGQRELAAGRASADVTQSFGLARAQMGRDLARRGVDPSSGAALAASSDMASQQALGLAGAANNARLSTQTQGYARKMDAANLGRGLASSQATSAGIALNQGNAATANAASGLASANNGVGAVQQGYASAQQGLSGAGSIYGQLAGQEAQTNATNSASTAAGVGAVGMVAGAVII